MLDVVQEQLEQLLTRRFGFVVHSIIVAYLKESDADFAHLFNDGFTWVHAPRSTNHIQLFSKWATL
jgi:hypothetical protein